MRDRCAGGDVDRDSRPADGRSSARGCDTTPAGTLTMVYLPDGVRHRAERGADEADLGVGEYLTDVTGDGAGDGSGGLRRGA